jgi:hypothetical protein
MQANSSDLLDVSTFVASTDPSAAQGRLANAAGNGLLAAKLQPLGMQLVDHSISFGGVSYMLFTAGSAQLQADLRHLCLPAPRHRQPAAIHKPSDVSHGIPEEPVFGRLITVPLVQRCAAHPFAGPTRPAGPGLSFCCWRRIPPLCRQCQQQRRRRWWRWGHRRSSGGGCGCNRRRVLWCCQGQLKLLPLPYYMMYYHERGLSSKLQFHRQHLNSFLFRSVPMC